MESQEKTKIIFLQSWRIFAIEAFLFSLTLLLGIITAFKMSKIIEIERILLSPPSLGGFIFYFVLATLFVFSVSFFLKFRKQKTAIFRIIFVLTVFSGGLLLLNVWLPDFVALVLIAILIFWWLIKPSIFIQDSLIILAMAGAGSVLGLSLDPQLVIMILIIFSIYDFIAVYKTKHMIKMAKEMIKSQAILGLVIPPQLKGFKENLREVKPGGKFLILGGGDAVFPLLLAVSVIPSGILHSLIIAFFAVIGLFASFFIFVSQKTRKPIPALPPIAFFSIIGYLITALF